MLVKGILSFPTLFTPKVAKGATEPKVEKYAINEGDWVTPNRKYAIDHGESNLGGNYKILSKKVRADELFTDANSIQEFGYSPRESTQLTKSQLTDIWNKEKGTSGQVSQKTVIATGVGIAGAAIGFSLLAPFITNKLRKWTANTYKSQLNEAIKTSPSKEDLQKIWELVQKKGIDDTRKGELETMIQKRQEELNNKPYQFPE